MPTYIMSYPAAGHPLPDGRPREAFLQWLQLCDHITRAGGHILVLDPPTGAPDAATRSTASPWQRGLPDTAYLGALFPQPRVGTGAVFLLSRFSDPAQGAGVSDAVAPLLAQAGLACRQSELPFAGQADLFSLGRGRYVLTFAGSTSRDCVAEVRELLPLGARLLEVELGDGFSHGIPCLACLSTPAGDGVLLVYAGGLKQRAIEEFSRFSGGELEVIPVDREDALAFACSSLTVRGTLLVPVGLSSSLRGQLLRRGFPMTEVSLSHLLPSGGPRDLINELPGYVLSDDAPSYSMRREELHRLAAGYPESGPAEAGERSR